MSLMASIACTSECFFNGKSLSGGVNHQLVMFGAHPESVQSLFQHRLALWELIRHPLASTCRDIAVIRQGVAVIRAFDHQLQEIIVPVQMRVVSATRPPASSIFVPAFSHRK